MRESAFKIYNASAGSGKTFTLVKEYLKIILAFERKQDFHQILAVTFTNKAVNEMKQRILDSLTQMQAMDLSGEVPEMALALSDELGYDLGTLQIRSGELLNRILHNYAFFDVSTIDKFTHRVIRSFAKELKISQNFEVVLDTDTLLNEAVDNLLAKSGDDPVLTRAIIDFALEKTEADKHWDVNADLFKVGKMLFRENDRQHIKKQSVKSVKDFMALQKQLRSEISQLEKSAARAAEGVLRLIGESGLSETDFPRKTLPNHFRKIRDLELDFDKLYNNKLYDNLEKGNILKSGQSLPNKSFPEEILAEYSKIKSLLSRWALLKNAYQNLVPLTVLNAIYQELKTIETDRELLPISSFNVLISNIIANQPAPFIYERLGEKYRHYFIDEFQDTSRMQWENLLPLVANSLESLDANDNPGTLLIVGDVKQAIYRWRGGQPEQFLNLISLKNNPFVIDPSVHSLDTNYRSREQIVQFNNAFFKTSSSLVANTSFERLFSEETHQKSNAKKGGLVQLEFIDCEDDLLEDAYLNRIKEAIEVAMSHGYSYRDISILTRKRKHGVLISQGLIGNEIPVVSSETLLLKSSSKVMFLIHLLKIAQQPDDLETQYFLLGYLVPKDQAYHGFVSDALKDLDSWMLEKWGFSMQEFKLQSVYDGLERAISQFGLVKSSDAFVTFLMDEVLLVEQRGDSSIAAFLEHWDNNQEKLSVTAPENTDAVRIMTIHKAKGLEFPIVIFPYANSNIYEEIDPKIWLQIPAEDYHGFPELLLSKKKQMLHYNEQANQLYTEDHQKLELDAFNLLYVALTRAIDALFILSRKDLDSSGLHKTNFFSGVFIEYLKESGIWSDRELVYSFGALDQKLSENEIAIHQEIVPYINSTKNTTAPNIVIRRDALWDELSSDPRTRGTLIHHLMGLIEKEADIEPALNRLKSNGFINADNMSEYCDLALKIIQLPELAPYFKENLIVKNEQEIITENGLILRPDRLVFEDEQVAILDYKTGARSADHREQLLSYRSALEKMGYIHPDCLIVYLNDTIEVEYIN
ncbi:MAG: UvrD-helicase domain-containing protein [Flavobacteriaceae bacterium]